MSIGDDVKKLGIHPEALRDLGGRVFWTLAGALFAVLATPEVVNLIDDKVHATLPLWAKTMVPSAAVLFTAVKSYIGAHVGDPTNCTFQKPAPPAATVDETGAVTAPVVFPPASNPAPVNIGTVVVNPPPAVESPFAVGEEFLDDLPVPDGEPADDWTDDDLEPGEVPDDLIP